MEPDLRPSEDAVRTRISLTAHQLALAPSRARRLRAIVDGLLLGDGSMSTSGVLCISQARVRKGWLSDIKQKLAAVGVCAKISKYSAKNSVIAGRPVRSSGGYTLRTLTYVEFKSERRRWYPAGIKIVPIDVDLSPISVAYWFCGDGTMTRHGYLNFCTDGFRRRAVMFLAMRLVSNGITAHCGRAGYSNNIRRWRYQVRICRRDAACALKKMIYAYIPRCCRYKFRFVRPTLLQRNRKLTNRQVNSIRLSAMTDKTAIKFARRYGVSTTTVQRAYDAIGAYVRVP